VGRVASVSPAVTDCSRRETRYVAVEAVPTQDVDGVGHGVQPEVALAGRLVRAWSPSEGKDSTSDFAPVAPLKPDEDL
jgi:hypothetical protein